MKFQVLNRRQVKEFQNQYHPYKSAIITIADTDKENLNISPSFLDNNNLCSNNIYAYLPLQFDDVEESTTTETVISEMDAKRIVKFVSNVKSKVDYIIVNCEAGVSRSAGVCAAIMLALNGDDSEIFNDSSKCPNMKCYRTVLREFEENGYFDEDTKGISEEEIKQKEMTNIMMWKIQQDL